MTPYDEEWRLRAIHLGARAPVQRWQTNNDCITCARSYYQQCKTVKEITGCFADTPEGIVLGTGYGHIWHHVCYRAHAFECSACGTKVMPPEDGKLCGEVVHTSEYLLLQFQAELKNE